MNPAPLTRLKDQQSQPQPTSTPVREAASPVASHLTRSSPRSKRSLLSERATPRSSRLGKEVFSASDEEGKEDESMDVDEK